MLLQHDASSRIDNHVQVIQRTLRRHCLTICRDLLHQIGIDQLTDLFLFIPNHLRGHLLVISNDKGLFPPQQGGQGTKVRLRSFIDDDEIKAPQLCWQALRHAVVRHDPARNCIRNLCRCCTSVLAITLGTNTGSFTDLLDCNLKSLQGRLDSRCRLLGKPQPRTSDHRLFVGLCKPLRNLFPLSSQVLQLSVTEGRFQHRIQTLETPSTKKIT